MFGRIGKGLLLVAVLIGSLNIANATRSDEPDYKEFAKVARYLVNKLDWTIMATISTLPELSGYPVADVVSYADSPIGENSTGEIYMLLTDLHSPEQDLLVDNKLTLLFSMAQYKNCSDPMEPTCARLMMTGSKSRIEENTEEHDFAMRALLSRHPRIKMWILYPYHEFYLAKVKIEYIMLQDFYGRPTNVPVDEYFTADPSTLQRRKSYRRIGRRRFYQRH